MEKTDKKSQNRKTGYFGENIACDFLIKKGYTVVERNRYTPYGEIDIICEDEKYIVFVEVKTRFVSPNIAKYGRPALAVNREKKSHMINSAKEYLRKNETSKKPRIDVIEVYLNRHEGGYVSADIKHYKNAVLAVREKSKYDEAF